MQQPTTKRVRFFNINWDTEDEGVNSNISALLPSEVTLDVDDDLDIAYEGADVLSDKFGWCVFGFDFEEKN